MSVRVASLVRKFGPQDHTDFIVLLALADHANDAGGDCWPSVNAIASEMRTSKRSVIRSLKTLATDGWIAVMKKSRDHKGNAYQLIIEKLKSGAAMAPVSDATVTPDKARVRCHTGASQVPHRSESGAKSAQPLQPLKGVTVLNVKEPSAQTPAFALPAWVPVDEWNGFIEMRTSMRKKPTLHAMNLLINTLDKLRCDGHNPGAVLDQSTANGWRGLFPLKDANGSSDDGLFAKDDALKRAAVERLFAYYVAQLELNPKLYTLTPKRMDMGLARLDDCQRKCNGNLEKAEKLMGIAIDKLIASDFHMGKNDQRRMYTDWTKHLFKDTDKLEWWLAR